VPMLLGFYASGNTSGFAVDQAWYEDSGIVFQLLVVLLVNAVAIDLIKVLQPVELIKHRIIAPIFKSQAKISSLFKPPKMHIGELYAASVKTVAMGLMYGTLYPPAYLITAASLLICYWGTRVGIAVWFRRPAAVDTDMLDRMIDVLSLTQGAAIALQAIIGYAAAETWEDVSSAVIASPVLWVLYQVLPLSYIPALAKHEQISALAKQEQISGGDTQGIRFDEVTAKTGFEMEYYECPLLEPGENAWDGVEKMNDMKGRSSRASINVISQLTKTQGGSKKWRRNSATNKEAASARSYPALAAYDPAGVADNV